MYALTTYVNRIQLLCVLGPHFELCMEITLQLRFFYLFNIVTVFDNVSFLFIIVTYFLLRHNYVIYLFDVVMFFEKVRITLYFGKFELRIEITLQLRFIFARHCDIFLLRHKYVIYLFVVVTFFDDVRITLYFGTFELRTEIT